MLFKYTAVKSDGRIVEDIIEAENTSEVFGFLNSGGLKPLKVTQIKTRRRFRLFGSSITLSDQMLLSRYFALMLRMGTNLLQAVNVLIEDFKKPTVRDFLFELRSNLERGQKFYVTFAHHPEMFSQMYTNLIKAGELSGNLENVFEDLAGSLVKEKNLRDQIRGALFYPLLLLGGSILMLFFLSVFALPKIAKVFKDSGFEPPLFSRIVFTIGLAFGKFGVYLIIFLIMGLITSLYLYRSSIIFKRFILNIVKDIPFLKDVIRKIALQRFAGVLASLIKAGVPFSEAILMTANAVGFGELNEALIRICKEGLEKGLTIGESFKKESYFPRVVVSIMTISEKAGHIDEVLDIMADFYANEIDNSLKILTSLFEPILLMLMGVVVGFIALAVVVPLYQLTMQF